MGNTSPNVPNATIAIRFLLATGKFDLVPDAHDWLLACTADLSRACQPTRRAGADPMRVRVLHPPILLVVRTTFLRRAQRTQVIAATTLCHVSPTDDNARRTIHSTSSWSACRLPASNSRVRFCRLVTVVRGCHSSSLAERQRRRRHFVNDLFVNGQLRGMAASRDAMVTMGMPARSTWRRSQPRMVVVDAG
jgi:hypothetical protein